MGALKRQLAGCRDGMQQRQDFVSALEHKRAHGHHDEQEMHGWSKESHQNLGLWFVGNLCMIGATGRAGHHGVDSATDALGDEDMRQLMQRDTEQPNGRDDSTNGGLVRIDGQCRHQADEQQ